MNVVKYRNINTTVGYNAEKILAIKDFICKEFVYGGHLIGLTASAIVLSAMLLMDVSIRWEFLLIAYLVTQCVYTYNHYKEMETDSLDNFNRTNHLKKYQKLLPLIITVYGVGFFALLFYFGNAESFIFGGAILLLGLLYTYKLKKLTKKIVGFKNIYTSVAVSLLILLTAFYYSYPINLLVILVTIFLFFNMVINTSFCDIKDMDSDRKQNLLTLPLYLGKQNFLLFLSMLHFLPFIIIPLGVFFGILPLYSLFLLIMFFYSFYYIQKVRDTKTDIQRLSSVILDGEFMIWPFLLFVGKIFVA